MFTLPRAFSANYYPAAAVANRAKNVIHLSKMCLLKYA